LQHDSPKFMPAMTGKNSRALSTPRVKHVCHPLLDERVAAYAGDDVRRFSSAPIYLGSSANSRPQPLHPLLLRTSFLARFVSHLDVRKYEQVI
jgi:hypothetical protein